MENPADTKPLPEWFIRFNQQMDELDAKWDETISDLRKANADLKACVHAVKLITR